MTKGEIILYSCIGFIVLLFILYHIIKAATNSNHHRKLLRMQVEILREIALKSGIESEKIDEIIERHES